MEDEQEQQVESSGSESGSAVDDEDEQGKCISVFMYSIYCMY